MWLISSLLKCIILALSIFNNKPCTSRIFFARTASSCPCTIKRAEIPFTSILHISFSQHTNKYPPAQPGVFPMRAKPSVLRVTRTTRNTVCQLRGDCYLRPVNGLPGALITICSPSLSSSNWCLIYSAIRPAFFPTVST